MSGNLYLRIMKEEIRDAPTAPTGKIRVILPSDNCAVFDDKVVNEMIAQARIRLRQLVKLRYQAQTHTHIVSEDYLKSLGVPFEVKKFVQKIC